MTEIDKGALDRMTEAFAREFFGGGHVYCCQTSPVEMVPASEDTRERIRSALIAAIGEATLANADAVESLRAALAHERTLIGTAKADFAAALKLVTDENRALRDKVTALTGALTVWCRGEKDSPIHPAAVYLEWSDREVVVCLDPLHIAEKVVNIALDHSYDRDRIAPFVRRVKQHPMLGIEACDRHVAEARVERACAAAREYLASVQSDWLERTVYLHDTRRDELLARCHAAAAGPDEANAKIDAALREEDR